MKYRSTSSAGVDGEPAGPCRACVSTAISIHPKVAGGGSRLHEFRKGGTGSRRERERKPFRRGELYRQSCFTGTAVLASRMTTQPPPCRLRTEREWPSILVRAFERLSVIVRESFVQRQAWSPRTLISWME